MRHFSKALLFTALALGALGLAACGQLEVDDSDSQGGGGSGDTTPPPPGLAVTLQYPPGVGGYRRFPFEGASDPLSRDLTLIAQHNRASYQSPEAFAQAQDAVDEAEARLAQDPPAVVSLIAETMGRLAPDDVEGYTNLISLVEVVRNDRTAVSLLQDLLMAPGPPPPPRGASCGQGGGGGAASCESTYPFRAVWQRALRSLDETARQGNDDARAAVLAAAGSPNASVRSMAVRRTYALAHSRRAAKEELAQILDPSEHYLLNRY